MIDIKILRNNPEIVEKALQNKGIKGVDLQKVIALDVERIRLQQHLDELRAKRNEISSKMGKGKPEPELLEEAKSLKEKIQNDEKIFAEIETEFYALYKKIPNIPTDDTPIGLTEDENVVVRQWGNIPQFDFEIKNHAEIGEIRDWIDKERAANVAGARFAYLKGGLVRLQMALVQWVMDTLANREILAKIIAENNLDVSDKPFVPILPPLMIKTEPYDAMDRLEPRDDRYKIEGQDLWLQGSAEHVLGSMHAGEIFEEKNLPIRYLGYATSFREEAGTYGKDMEGIIRMHQFDKLEMESFSVAEKAHDEYLLFVAIQEYLMQQLEIPYQKLQKCTFDIGRLEFIAKNENIEAEKEALELIAEQARGGMRDAITLFEQFSSSGTVTLKNLETELSLISKKTLQEIIQAISNQDKKWLEDILEKLKSEHINARNFFDSILYILRDELRVHLEHSNFQKYQNITEIFIKNYNSIRNFSDEMLLIEITLYQAFWSVTLWEHQIETPKIIPNIKPQIERKTEWTIQNNLETKIITPKAEKTNITEERHENTQEIEAINTEIETEKSFHFVQFINACKKHAPIFLPLKSATFDRNENNLCLKTASKWNYNILNDEKNKVIMKQILTETFGGDDWNISVQISDNHQSQVAAVDEIF